VALGLNYMPLAPKKLQHMPRFVKVKIEAFGDVQNSAMRVANAL